MNNKCIDLIKQEMKKLFTYINTIRQSKNIDKKES